MSNLRPIATVLATIFSITFALLLFPEIVDDHGALRASAVVLLGVGVIWLLYFTLGHLFGRIYDQGKRDSEESSNTDFV